MRKLIASEFVSLDSLIVGTNEDITWVTNNFNEEMGNYAGTLQSSMGAILLGRVTYEIMIGFWPAAGDVPGAKEMNTTPKYIVSKTLDKAEWGTWNNATVLKDNITEQVQKLKQQPGKDIVIYGSGTLVSALTQAGLIDEYHFLLHPIVVGSGKPLFKGITSPVNMKLLRTGTFKNGVVVLYYAPAKN